MSDSKSGSKTNLNESNMPLLDDVSATHFKKSSSNEGGVALI